MTRSLGGRFAIASLSVVLATGMTAGTASAADPPMVDDFESALASGSADGVPIGFYAVADPSSSAGFAATTSPPAPVPAGATPNTVLRADLDVSSWGVIVHAFESADATTWVTQDWSAYAGLKFWMYGTGSGTSMFVDVIDNRPEGSVVDNAERWSVAFVDDTPGWRLVELPFDSFARKEIGNGAPNDGFTLTEVHGWAFGSLATGGPTSFYLDDVQTYGTAPVRPLTVGFAGVDTAVVEGDSAVVGLKLTKASDTDVSVTVRSTTGTAEAGTDYRPVDQRVTIPAGSTRGELTVETIDNGSYQGERAFILELRDPVGVDLGRPPLTRVNITDDEAHDPTLIAGFEGAELAWTGSEGTTADQATIQPGDALAQPGQSGPEGILRANGPSTKRTVGTTFPDVQDWSANGGISFDYYGAGTGKPVKVTIGSATADPAAGDPSTWRLAWSDDFRGRAGSAPDPATWVHEVGDGTIIGKPGWGNDELEYYTDSVDNAALDGRGNLVITTKVNDDPNLLCYYGPCAYTSARLTTQNLAEFAYGRIESRIKVPSGAGLWPAFWSLGADITTNPWPNSGEIDIMEVVGREPNTVFGTIHGPGYSGGQSFGDHLDFTKPVADAFHTFAVQWSPNQITWSVDGRVYHRATPGDVAPNQWVFEHPFFLLLNTAVGGNFGGPVGADTSFPQRMIVDYVRVYQGPRREQSFTSSFVDNQVGWRHVVLPFAGFTSRRGSTLDASTVSSLSITAPAKAGRTWSSGPRRAPRHTPKSTVVALDNVRLTCSDATTVTTTADSGAGSLRAALGATCGGGQISVDPALRGQRVLLGSTLPVATDVTVSGEGLILDGGGTSRVLDIAAGAQVEMQEVTITGGYGYELAGGVINHGALTLADSTVQGNRVTTSGNEYWKGGGGIYTAEGGQLTLRNSSVRDNQVQDGPGGGLYAFTGTTTRIESSVVTGNSATDVGGGMRSLGTVVVSDSTFSGNAATGWHGGGIFVTDGTATITGSTITGNSAPDGTTGGLFVGTFGDAEAHALIGGSTITGNTGPQCFLAPYGAGAVSITSNGGNTFSDATCGSGPGDVIG